MVEIVESEYPNSQFALRSSHLVWLVVGLGNPGVEYAGSYHNAGFRVVERLAQQNGVSIQRKCGAALISDAIVLGGQTAVLVEPQTYMNRSGAALPLLLERFQASMETVIAVYDDLALPLGRIRVRPKGSAGGHNGIKSLIASAGTDEFIRVRVGIQPDRETGDVRDFVLSRVAVADSELLAAAEAAAAGAVAAVIAGGVEKAMAACNGIDLRQT